MWRPANIFFSESQLNVKIVSLESSKARCQESFCGYLGIFTVKGMTLNPSY